MVSKSPIAIVLLASIALAVPSSAAARAPASRYFHHGDGGISLATDKGRARFSGRFRNPDGTYDEGAMRRINMVFLTRYGEAGSEISPRLIEFIDFIQDHFDPSALVTITSGYRSPTYNKSLRNKGRLAAKASLHQYGMAADLRIKGVPSEKIWNFIKQLGFGGAGYYHGRNVHVDVGPARSWDETTSGVGTGISDHNKLIGIVTDKDIYLPGEVIEMRFIRMTEFPIRVSPTFVIEREGRRQRWFKDDIRPAFPAKAKGSCPEFSDIGQMLGITYKLPDDIKPGRYRICATLCNKGHEEMPDKVTTPQFEVAAR